MRTAYIHYDGLEDEPLETRIVEKVIEGFCSSHLANRRINDELLLLIAKYRSRLSYLNKLYNHEKKYEQQELEVE
tara:strand:- start:577 stop:801 length:225 start_codon:yes stop_codon:yes gene_type:complete